MSDCYIEGTVDFIFGDADAYITDSTIHMAAFAGRTSGYFTAANTKAGYTGLVFTNCTLTADEGLDEVYLGRPWQNLAYYSGTHYDDAGHTIYEDFDASRPHPNYENVSSAVTFIGCTMPSNIADEHWSPWMGRTENNGSMKSITYEPTVRFSEIGCTYPGGEPNENKLFLGGGGSFVATSDQDTIDDAIANALASMNFGTWSPSTFERVDDADAWNEETNPGDSTDTDGATSSDGSTGQGSTGSSTTTDNGEAGGSSDNGSAGSNGQQTASDDESDTDAAAETSTASEADGASASSASDLPATDDASGIFAVIAFVGVVLCVAGVAIKRS